MTGTPSSSSPSPASQQGAASLAQPEGSEDKLRYFAGNESARDVLQTLFPSGSASSKTKLSDAQPGAQAMSSDLRSNRLGVASSPLRRGGANKRRYLRSSRGLTPAAVRSKSSIVGKPELRTSKLARGSAVRLPIAPGFLPDAQ